MTALDSLDGPNPSVFSGDEPLSICRASTTFDEASAMLARNASPLGRERVPMRDSVGRVLASPVLAGIDAPRWDVSAMDGFAVNDADVIRGIGSFRLVGNSFPGRAFKANVRIGETVRIFTGARVPANATRIFVQENAVIDGESVTFANPGNEKRHIRALGSDFRKGDLLLEPGITLEPRHLVAAAGGDVGFFDVWRRPTVHLFTTGDELTEPGKAVLSGQIPESISHSVAAYVEQWGGQAISYNVLRDDPAIIANGVQAALGAADLIVVIGGASRGSKDFSKSALQQLGLMLHFSSVAMKPGKPVWYGRIGSTHIIGLPGNPTAAMTTARLFLAPLIHALTGRDYHLGLKWFRSPMGSGANSGDSRDHFLCAEWHDGNVVLVDRQEASSQILLVRANALVRKRRFAAEAEAGSLAEVLLL